MSAARSLASAAAVVYGGTALLGVGLATGLWRNRRHRWVHHVGYIAAVSLTAAAALAAALAEPARARAAALALVPLAALPRVPTRSRRHPLVALTAAPWLIAAAARHR